MLEDGWTIKSAHQNGRDDVYASHRIVFEPPNTPRYKEVGDVTPTATLFNSHNRTKMARFTIGFFRTWCSNQCQVSILSAQTTKMHLKGVGFDSAHFLDKAMEGFSQLPGLFSAMQQRILTPSERQTFGRQALSIKYYSDTTCAALYTPEAASEILTPNRIADSGMDLWATYNTAQENILHGSRRGINEVNRNQRLNLELWSAAQAFLN
jgi:hypothetical protein